MWQNPALMKGNSCRGKFSWTFSVNAGPHTLVSEPHTPLASPRQHPCCAENHPQPKISKMQISDTSLSSHHRDCPAQDTEFQTEYKDYQWSQSNASYLQNVKTHLVIFNGVITTLTENHFIVNRFFSTLCNVICFLWCFSKSLQENEPTSWKEWKTIDPGIIITRSVLVFVPQMT